MTMTMSDALEELGLELPASLDGWPARVRAARNARLRAGSQRAITAATIALGLRWRARDAQPSNTRHPPALWLLRPLLSVELLCGPPLPFLSASPEDS